MLSNIGLTEFLLVGIVVLILFGPKKLPELGRALGHSIREFKKATKGLIDEDVETSQSNRDADKGFPLQDTKPSQQNQQSSNLPE
jgi:sec-independent protein translocase protein TatA